MKNMTFRKSLTAAAVAASLGFPALAVAQDAQQNTATEQAEEQVERIQVTGSRIGRIGAEAPSPVTVISGEDLTTTGAMNIGEVLSRLPALATTFTLANSGRFIGTAGVSTLNLRNMGTDRTLVLVNGKRHVSSTPGSSAVDTNTIPSAWIDRVEIITGGASAVYGADAVTGVVNFILKENIEGLDVTATRGYAENSNYQNEKYTFSYGVNFDDGRGNIAFSAEHNSQNSLNALDNPWTAESVAEFPYATVMGEPRPEGSEDDPAYPDFITVRDAGYYVLSRGGTAWNPNVAYYGPGIMGAFNDNGSFGEVYTGDVNDLTHCQNCDYLNLRQFSEIQPKFSRTNYNLKGNYEVSNDLNLYFDAKYVNSKGQSIGQPFFTFGRADANATVYRDNAFLPDGLASQMDEQGLDYVHINRMYGDLGRRVEDNTRETTRFVFGAEGNLTADWSYDASLIWGKSEIERANGANVIMQNHAWAMDAVEDADGNIVCRSEEARADGCVPANFFGDGNVSQEAIDYITTTSIGTSDIEQRVLAASVSNPFLFEMPAGFVGFAAGAEYREEETSTSEDPFAATGATFFNALGETHGEYDVSEIYSEVSVPLLADAPFVRDLTFDAAIRLSDYSTIGNTTTWKAGLDWAINDELRARFTYSEAIRAPNIDELFSSQGQSFAQIDDPCRTENLDNQTAESRAQREANCAALGVPEGFNSEYDAQTLELLVGGNPDLMEETSESVTAGFIYRPEWFKGFSATVDYWEIEIDDTISSVPTQTIVDRCVDGASIDNQFCDLIDRNDAGEITLIQSFALNIARSLNSGVDFEFAYDTELYDGRLSTTLLGTYLIEAKDFPFSDEPDNYTDYAGYIGEQDLQAQITVNYMKDNWKLGWTTRYLNRVDLYDHTELENNPNPSSEMEYGSYAVSDVTVGYSFDNGVGVTLGVDNVLNRELPGFTTGTGAGSAIYDNIGRFAYLRASYQF